MTCEGGKPQAGRCRPPDLLLRLASPVRSATAQQLTIPDDDTTFVVDAGRLDWRSMGPGVTGIFLRGGFDSDAPDPFLFLIRLDPGRGIPRHRHQVPETIRTLWGTAPLGVGVSADTASYLELAVGHRVTVPAGVWQGVRATEPTILLVSARGPLTTEYLTRPPRTPP